MGRTIMKDEPIVCTTNSATSGICSFTGVAAATVYVPNGSSITTLTFFPTHTLTAGSATVTRSTVAMKDETNTTISLTVAANQDTEMPKSLFGCDNFVIKADAAGTVYVTAKS